MRNEVACEAARKAARKAAKEERIKVARRLLKLGKLSYEEIAEMAELPINEVKALSEKVIA